MRFFFCKSSFISVIVRCKLQILILNCFEQKRGIFTQRLLHWLICSSFFFSSNIQLSKSPKSNRILNFRMFYAFIATQKHVKHIHHSLLVIYQYLHILHNFFGHYYCAQCLKNIACNGHMMSLNYATFLPFILFAPFKMCNISFFHLVMFFIWIYYSEKKKILYRFISLRAKKLQIKSIYSISFLYFMQKMIRISRERKCKTSVRRQIQITVAYSKNEI